MPGKHTSINVFTACKGINDSIETSVPFWSPDGITEIIECSNLTVTPNGKLVRPASYSTVFLHTENITDISAGQDFIVQAGTSVYSYSNSSFSLITNAQSVVEGTKSPIIQTPIDARIGTGDKIYNGVAYPLVYGGYTGPPLKKVLSAMPSFEGGFVHGSKLYVWNGKFLQYSMPYAYDAFDLADGFIGHSNSIVQGNRIPNCILLITTHGVITYTGDEPFIKMMYSIPVIPGTLFSGFLPTGEQGHVFLANDGVYVCGMDGKLVNLTGTAISRLNSVNTIYHTAVIDGLKYFAYGDNCCVEFDFSTKAAMFKSAYGITSSCIYKNKTYYSKEHSLLVSDNAVPFIEESCHVAFPYTDLGIQGNKQIRFLYFTGHASGDVTFTVRNQYGVTASKTVTIHGYVQNYKVDSLRLCKGQRLSIKIESTASNFSVEELKAAVVTTSSYH